MKYRNGAGYTTTATYRQVGEPGPYVTTFDVLMDGLHVGQIERGTQTSYRKAGRLITATYRRTGWRPKTRWDERSHYWRDYRWEATEVLLRWSSGDETWRRAHR